MAKRKLTREQAVGRKAKAVRFVRMFSGTRSGARNRGRNPRLVGAAHPPYHHQSTQEKNERGERKHLLKLTCKTQLMMPAAFWPRPTIQ